ncbi:MAG: PDZ domain-containing protein [Deltaproteobacteria bacterium]|nr:PDZ domain-containing protein [Deltaproteobacteria bacterium]
MKVPKMAFATLFFVLTCFLFAPLSFAGDETSPAPMLASPSSQQQTQRPWLGVSILEVDEKVARHMDIKATKGLVVVDVVQGGPADDAGLRQGDVIVRLNGREMTDFNEFIEKVQEAGIGASVLLGIDRAGNPDEVEVTLEAMPAPAPMVSKGYGQGMGQGYMGEACPQHAKSLDKMCPMGRECPMGDDCPVRSGKPCAQCQAGIRGQGYGYGHACLDRSGRGRHYRGAGDGMMRHGGTYSPMYGKIKMAIKGMDLTSDQRAKLSAISSEYRKKAIKAMADAKIAHMELHEMLASDPVSLEKVRSKVNDIGKRKADMMLSGIKALEDIKKVLTPAQRKSLRDTLSMDSSDTEEDMDGGEAAEGAE